jgi:hypothetical protein
LFADQIAPREIPQRRRDRHVKLTFGCVLRSGTALADVEGFAIGAHAQALSLLGPSAESDAKAGKRESQSFLLNVRQIMA